jgi:magnesium-protoporphyrin O-methyltransferase
VFSHPPRNLATRAVIVWENTWRRLTGNTFRTFMHPPRNMVAALEEAGLRPTYRWRGFGWRVVGLER